MLEKPSAAFVLGDWKKNGRNNGLTGKKEANDIHSGNQR
jgi:hypothetical protein